MNHLLKAVASVENDWGQQNVEEYLGVKCDLKKEGKDTHFKMNEWIKPCFCFFVKDVLFCRVRYLAQHVILLHIVDLSGVDLPFQGVLKEFTADIKQQGADGPLSQHAARRCLVVIAGGGDAIAQDHAHQQAWGGVWQQYGKQTENNEY